eukprot:TRINITY_DN10111_c0_g2_i1.p1 TRINITY_DN10111_c0_g2~~TRINITY_DN10111_c0_g2_i1.p1  ORF type:complete len:223 (-),score=22.40 TRINITY_DN10111_c0_g2_i1:206-874(-)
MAVLLCSRPASPCDKGTHERPSGFGWKYSGSTPLVIENSVHLDLVLDPELEYLVLPISFTQKPCPTNVTVVTVSAYSVAAHGVQIQGTTSELNSFLAEYMRAPEVQVSTWEGVETRERKDGCGVLISHSNRNFDRWFTVEHVVTDQINMDVSRESQLTQDSIPPGHSQFVLAITATQPSYSYNLNTSKSLSHNPDQVHVPPLELDSCHQPYFSGHQQTITAR